MGCGAAEAAGLGFVCFVVINSRVLLGDRVDFGLVFFFLFFFFHKTSILLSPAPPLFFTPSQGLHISLSLLKDKHQLSAELLEVLLKPVGLTNALPGGPEHIPPVAWAEVGGGGGVKRRKFP